MPDGGYALSGLQTKHSASRGVSRVAAFRLTRATGLAHHCTGSVGPRKRSAAGHGHSQGAACMPDGGYALSSRQTKHSASRGISRVAAFRLTRATGQCKQ
ncbi:hypothetical protein BN1007_200067 [Klebsiella variicola]|nr:hypothetical protein BN1007_200067 [Klebsiella variicola]CTQ13766.1 hypothetical protein BN1200_1660045 [Klebsiella variicola]